MRNSFPYLWFALFLSGLIQAQEKKTYKIRTIAFYNVENLFDIENDSLTFDDDRTPEGKYHWTPERYDRKIEHLSKVIAEIGSEVGKASPDLIGLCEVENLQVLEDLAAHKKLASKNYGIIHFDSPDKRGIDVALLYKETTFVPTSFDSRRLLLFDGNEKRNYTRDQLVVGGLMDGEQIYLIVNHWPSRSGGQARSEPYRMAAAKLNKRIMDSLTRLDADARIISMGDLNDDPMDKSLKTILRTQGNPKKIEEGGLFNPMERLYRKGIGSLAYRDQWNLFDQIFLTANLVNPEEGQYRFWKAGIFNPPYLVTKKGPYKGYPFRTYAGGNYMGGYSDHFPVYVYLIKEAK